MPDHPDFTSINLSHPLQDVHRVRQERAEHYRYKLARELFPSTMCGKRVLELGCGRSEFARQLAELGFEIVVTDLSPSNVEFARSLGFNAHRIDLNLGLSAFESQSFDLVIILDVIEHIVQVEFLLLEIFRVLKSGGYLILSTPNFVFFANRMRIFLGNLSIDEGYHFRFFTVKSLHNQLKKAGFEVEDWRFVMPPLGLNRIWRLLGKGKPKKIPVPKWLAPLFGQTMAVRSKKP